METWSGGDGEIWELWKGMVCFAPLLHVSQSPRLVRYGTIFVAGSLHGPSPFVPMARTRTQMREPLVSPVSVVLEALVCLAV